MERRIDSVEEMEKLGIKVTVVTPSGDVTHQTNCTKCAGKCNGCPYMKLLPDPDPDDWFRDDDQMAFCALSKKAIERSLEYNEIFDIKTPNWCQLEETKEK